MQDKNNEEEKYNPFSTSSIDDILKRREQRMKRQAITKEDVEEYTRALNRIFASPDGQFVLKKIIKYCGIHSFDNELNPAKLVEDRGRKGVYLEMIRPFLEKKITAEVENY